MEPHGCKAARGGGEGDGGRHLSARPVAPPSDHACRTILVVVRNDADVIMIKETVTFFRLI